MIKQKDQLTSASRIFNYFWFLPLAGAGVLFWWINNWVELLALIWIFIAYYTVAVIRGKYSSLPILASLYMFAFIACTFLLGIKLAFLGMPGEARPMSVLGPMVTLNVLPVIAFIAYFAYKKEILMRKVRQASFREPFFVKVFWLLLGGVVALYFFGVLTAQLSISIIAFLLTLVAVGAGLMGMWRTSWRWAAVSFLFFLAAAGFAILKVVWDPQDDLSVSILTGLCMFVVILLTYMIGSVLVFRTKVKR